MRKGLFFFVWLLLNAPNDSFSEDVIPHDSEALSVMAEEQMVVTPSRYLQSVNHSPSTVSVITSEEIKAIGATTIPDLLRSIPGVEVMQTTSTEHVVSMRGDNQLLANKLLVLIDGRTVHDELENLVFWNAFPIGLNEIERIEIIRGPGSAVWGANAFDGVVNIISKNPSDISGTVISLSGGEGSYGNGNFIHGGTAGPVEYKISAGYQRVNTWRDNGLIGEEVSRGNVSMQHRFDSERKISFSAGTSDSPLYDGPLFDNGISSSGIRQAYVQGGYEERDSFLRMYWNTLSYKADFFRFEPDPILFPNSLHPNLYAPDPAFNYAFDLYHLEGQHQFLLLPILQIVIGANYRMTDVRGDLIAGRHQVQVLGGYLQSEWTPIEALTLIAGARYDDVDFESMHPNFTSPRASLLYRFDTLHQLIRLSYSEAYRTPTALELYQCCIASPTGNLNPERIKSYEAGYSVVFLEQIKTELNLYFNRLTDLIDIQGDPITNLINADIYGGEISEEFLLTRKLKLFANYAYQEIHQSLEGTTANYPFNSAIRAGPTQKLNVGGEIKFLKNFYSQLQLHYLTSVQFPPTYVAQTANFPIDIPTYTQVNLKVGYHFWKDKMEFGVSVINLFHDVHREYPLGDEIGSRLLVQLNADID